MESDYVFSAPSRVHFAGLSYASVSSCSASKFLCKAFCQRYITVLCFAKKLARKGCFS